MTMQSEPTLMLPGLIDFSRGNEHPQLIGSHCGKCDRYFFPSMSFCAFCGDEVGPSGLGDAGLIYSHTTIRVKPPLGLPMPYSVAYIDLVGKPLRVFVLLDPDDDESYSIGQPVRLRIRELGLDSDGKPCLRPVFSNRISMGTPDIQES